MQSLSKGQTVLSNESIDRSSLKSSSPLPEDDMIFCSQDNIKSSSPLETPNRGVCLNNIQDDMSPPSEGFAGKEQQYHRRRRSSLQAKLDRRRRKNYELGIQLPSENNLNSLGDEEDGRSTATSSAVDINASQDIDSNNGNQLIYFPKQKRHSWWNIFMPEKHKSRYNLIFRDCHCKVNNRIESRDGAGRV